MENLIVIDKCCGLSIITHFPRPKNNLLIMWRKQEGSKIYFILCLQPGLWLLRRMSNLCSANHMHFHESWIYYWVMCWKLWRMKSPSFYGFWQMQGCLEARSYGTSFLMFEEEKCLEVVFMVANLTFCLRLAKTATPTVKSNGWFMGLFLEPHTVVYWFIPSDLPRSYLQPWISFYLNKPEWSGFSWDSWYSEQLIDRSSMVHYSG